MGVGEIGTILLFIPLAWLFQLKWARCSLLNAMDFHFWITFGKNYKFRSSNCGKLINGKVCLKVGGWKRSKT